MAYDFSPLKKRIDEIKEWFQGEIKSVHTGRATPGILDSVLVESYGAKTPIPHMAAVSVEDPRTLRVSPYDKSVTKDMEKAIEKANLGVTISVDDAGCRVHFPELSGERREVLAKSLRKKLEEARVSVRGERDDVWNDIQKQTQEGEMTEDDKFTFKEQLQELVDDATKELEEMTEHKEKEIQG